MEDFDFNEYYQNHDVDISWLSKPSQHGFRWRCSDGSWRKSKGVSAHKTALGKQ